VVEMSDCVRLSWFEFAVASRLDLEVGEQGYYRVLPVGVVSGFTGRGC
jgi:hypothetical protein